MHSMNYYGTIKKKKQGKCLQIDTEVLPPTFENTAGQ